MIVSICGNGYCGSSAVTDLLKDSEQLSITKADFEFSFLYDVDGILDLKSNVTGYHNKFFSCDAAIKRFIQYIHQMLTPNSFLGKKYKNEILNATSKFIDEITDISWNGWWQFDVRNAGFFYRNWNFRFLLKINSLLKKMHIKQFKVCKNNRMFLSINMDDFDNAATVYIDSLLKIIYGSKTDIVLDQPFPVGQGFLLKKYFKDPIIKNIIVKRDPRDIFVAAKKINTIYSTWIPTDNVEDFILYFKTTYLSYDSEKIDSLIINFEDLIYEYEKTKNVISNFLNIQINDKKSFFDPLKSINNTQLFKKYDDCNLEVKKIEEELSEYLYDFEKYPQKPNWEGSF